ERFGERERLIDDLYSKEVAQIGGNDTFGTSGTAKGSKPGLFANRQPRIISLLERIFGPKLPRIIIVIVVLLGAQRMMGSTWSLVPFVLAVAALHCLAEDTETSRKLFVVILSRLRLGRHDRCEICPSGRQPQPFKA